MNKGYIYEKILLNSLHFNKSQYESCFFIKSPTPCAKSSEKKELIYVSSALNDFVGIFHNRFIAIELKTTLNNIFNFNAIKKHQKVSLSEIQENGGLSFVVIVFVKVKKIFLLNFKNFSKIKSSKMSISEITENNYFSKIEFLSPFTINILEKIMDYL